MYEQLTAHISDLERSGCGTAKTAERGDGVMTLPAIDYPESVRSLWAALYAFHEKYPEYDLANYLDNVEKWHLLPKNGDEPDPSRMDGRKVVTLLFWAMRGERFCDGLFMEWMESGRVLRCLKRLRELDEEASG